MDVGCLFSGGKDSALAALFLGPHADVTLVTASFGLTDDWHHAREAAAALDLPFQRVDLDPDVLREAADQVRSDGFPRNGIQQIHEHALEVVAASGAFDAVADGTRRDDRVPTVDRSLAQSVEDRFEVAHLAPLAGVGRDAIDALAADHLAVETGPSEDLRKGDYEAELRALLSREGGEAVVEELFPPHVQSRVTGRHG
ncbi:asparagine synthase-related protein [Halobacteriales archaeon Cl-PHB]